MAEELQPVDDTQLKEFAYLSGALTLSAPVAPARSSTEFLIVNWIAELFFAS